MKQNNRNIATDSSPQLLGAIIMDIKRHWLVGALVVVFVYSAMILAKTTHLHRMHTGEWQELKQYFQNQQISWSVLRLKLATISEANQISDLAKSQLGMINVTTKNEKVITL